MNARRRAIGVFDSGVGGLTVVRALKKRLPSESLVYLGDTARVPYGSKSPETVARFASEAMRFFRGRGVKLVVVACNTVSSVALATCRREARSPVVSVLEPGVRAAAAATRNMRLAVLGTRATIQSGAYRSGLLRLLPRAHVVSSACPLFVPLAEEGWERRPAARSIAREYLRPVMRARVDTVVLGCTHYPLLAGVLRSLLGPRVALIDSADETARAVETELRRRHLAAPGGSRGPSRYFVTDSPEGFRRVAERFLRASVSPLALVRLGGSRS